MKGGLASSFVIHPAFLLFLPIFIIPDKKWQIFGKN